MALPAPLHCLSNHGLRCLALAAFVLAVLPLAVAYGSELFFGLHPCPMCYWQRVPYGVIIVLALLARFVPSAGFQLATLWLSVLAFVVAAGLGAFHAGVEWQWWEGPTTCGGGLDASGSAADILAQLKAAASVSCSEAAVRVLGISMAGWNALYAIACTGLLVFAIITRKEDAHAV